MKNNDAVCAHVATSTLSSLQQRAVLGMYYYYMGAFSGNVEKAYKQTLSDFEQASHSVYTQLIGDHHEENE